MMKLLVALLLALSLGGCSARIDDYRGMQPVLDLRDYFNGPLTAWGQFQDRSGKVVKRFRVDMTGTWKGDSGTLEELFTYDDGSRETRIWTLTRHGNGRYTGRANDVIGEAQGMAAGPALQWSYTLALPVDGKTYHVRFDDWMYLQDEQTLINRAVMSKFGVRLGEVTLFFRKEPAP
ncbi:MAG: DUF3833 domain-containing protein [Gammaproteobacteria bacterium]